MRTTIQWLSIVLTGLYLTAVVGCIQNHLFLTVLYLDANSQCNTNMEDLGIAIYTFDDMGNAPFKLVKELDIEAGTLDTFSFFGGDHNLIRYKGVNDCISEWQVIPSGDEYHLRIDHTSETATLTIDGSSASNRPDTLSVMILRQINANGDVHPLQDCESSFTIEDITYDDFPLSPVTIAKNTRYRIALSRKQSDQYFEINVGTVNTHNDEFTHSFTMP